MTVRQAVLETILNNYPRVPSHKIHQAHPKHPLSGSQRLRELKKDKVKYTHHFRLNGKPYQHYDFSKTPRKKISKLLKAEKIYGW